MAGFYLTPDSTDEILWTITESGPAKPETRDRDLRFVRRRAVRGEGGQPVNSAARIERPNKGEGKFCARRSLVDAGTEVGLDAHNRHTAIPGNPMTTFAAGSMRETGPILTEVPKVEKHSGMHASGRCGSLGVGPMLSRRNRRASPRRSASLATIAALIGGLACDEATRCWDDGTCSSPDAGERSEVSSGAATEATSGTTETANSSGETGSDAGGVASTSTSDDATSGMPSGGPSSSNDVIGSSADTDTNESSSSGTTQETGTSTEGPTCQSDDECGGLVCAEGACSACDPVDHRGCETSSDGNRCRASDNGNTCVVCLPGDPAPVSEVACGINGRGTPVIECVNGIWQTTACNDADVCTDGESQVGTTVCGPNGDGHYLAECKSGQWIDDTGSCIDDDQCVNGTRRPSESECGFSGYLEQQCVNGSWLTQSNRCLECLRKYRVPDPLFESSLTERNDIQANPVDPASVKYMSNLDLSFSSIQDITGIQCFTSLSDLNLGKNNLSDLSPLASLTQLVSLNLAYNALSGSDLSPLGALTQLTYLSLEASSAPSLAGLETLTSMQELRVPYCNIEDVSPLLTMTSLQSLSIYGNPYLQCESDAFATLRLNVPELYSDCP